jgi:hypothetical protein
MRAVEQCWALCEAADEEVTGPATSALCLLQDPMGGRTER